MTDMPMTPQWPQGPPPAPAGEAHPGRSRRLLKVAVGVVAAAGVAVGATALTEGATSSATPASNRDASVTASGSSTTTTTQPTRPHVFGGPDGFGRFGGPGAFGGLGLGGGSVLYGQYTVKGPNGYETLSERTGTVSDVTDTSGSTWSLTVKSADGTSGTFTVDTGTSVNGGEMGIGSVKTGDSVQVTAVVSGGTSTAKTVIDRTSLQANGGSWRPAMPQPSSNSGSGTSSSQSATPPV